MVIDMVPFYLVGCWMFGIVLGYSIGRFHALKKVSEFLDKLGVKRAE